MTFSVFVPIGTHSAGRLVKTNAKTGELYNIRTIVPTDDRAGFEITAESGVTI